MKNTLIVTLILLFAVNGYSQRNLRFGISGAPQISWFSSDNKAVETDGARFGLNYGLDIDYFFADNYAVTTGISIANTGGELKFDKNKTVFNGDTLLGIFDKETSVTYKLQYVNVPVALKFRTNEIGYMTYYGQVGFTMQVNTKAIATATSGTTIKDEKANEDIAFMNMGYHIGAGLEYSLGGSTSLIAGLYYTNGFLDVIQIKEYQVGDNKKALKELEGKEILNKISLRVGFMF